MFVQGEWKTTYLGASGGLVVGTSSGGIHRHILDLRVLAMTSPHSSLGLLDLVFVVGGNIGREGLTGSNRGAGNTWLGGSLRGGSL